MARASIEEREISPAAGPSRTARTSTRTTAHVARASIEEREISPAAGPRRRPRPGPRLRARGDPDDRRRPRRSGPELAPAAAARSTSWSSRRSRRSKLAAEGGRFFSSLFFLVGRPVQKAGSISTQPRPQDSRPGRPSEALSARRTNDLRPAQAIDQAPGSAMSSKPKIFLILTL